MKVYLDTIGCRLNQSEIEHMAIQFRTAGHTIVQSAAEADWVVVNTCAVTAEAASDSRQHIRQAVKAGAGEVLVTGCWATLDQKAALDLTGVTRVFMNDQKDQLVSNFLDLPQEIFDHEPLAREPLPGLHLRTRAFIKAQDGCDNHCTFCITRIARGRGRSLPVAEILQQIERALKGGAQEIVLSGVHLGSWGSDFEHPLHLADLVKTVLHHSDVSRLRLSSVEPWDLEDTFFRLWEDPRLCRHLHLPLQSGSASVLHRMARKTTPDSYRALVTAARTCASQMALTTDMIVGFPGETESEFEESLAFCQEIQFSAGHIFSYSVRPGTPAARLPGQLSGTIIKARSARLRSAFQQMAEIYREAFTGQSMSVLWESADSLNEQGWRVQGLTDNYLRVSAIAPQSLWNTISTVRLDRPNQTGFDGTIVS